MTYFACAIDFDDCLIHYDDLAAYLAAPPDNNLVITTNLPFFSHIQAIMDVHDFSGLFVGSSRQDDATDNFNNWRKKTGLCFPAMQKISTHLNCPLQTILLADIFGPLEEGTSFSRSIDPTYEGSHSQAVFDVSKVTVTLTHLHYASLAHPDEPVTYHLYDDRDDILDSLREFYTKYPYLVPNNVNLSLWHYEGEAISHRFSMQGTGLANPDYQEVVRKLSFQLAPEPVNYAIPINVAKNSEPWKLQLHPDDLEHESGSTETDIFPDTQEFIPQDEVPGSPSRGGMFGSSASLMNVVGDGVSREKTVTQAGTQTFT